jgi:hypothetical protein
MKMTLAQINPLRPEDLIVPPPTPRILDYPATIGLACAVLFTAVLLIVASRFDPSHGVLTLSLVVVLSFIGAVTFCLFFTVPADEITASVVGGLTAGFGAVISHWLGPQRNSSDGDNERHR